MSTVLKFRRGNTAAANAFTGQEGELFVDTTKDTLVVHDGVTAGGVPLATESYVTTQIGNLSLFSGSYDDLTNKPTIPTTTSQLTNNSGFITSSALSGYATESYVGTQLSTKQNTLVSGNNIKTINGYSLLGTGNINIAGGGSSLVYGQFADNQVDLTSTSTDQVIDTYSASLYRSSKYIIQAVCSGVGLHTTEIVLLHDGTNVYITEYGTLFTDTSLFTVDANITAGDVNLTVTPVNANTSFDVVRTSLAARPYEAPSLQGDLMTLSGAEDLQTATGSVDLNA